VVPSWVLLAGIAVCLAVIAAAALAIYLGSLREPSRPDD
jgi:hypothetical protein